MRDAMRARHMRLHVESLEDRRLLVAAMFAEISDRLGLVPLRGGSGEFHAGGLVFTDLNRDGFPDLYLIGPSGQGNRLFVNVADGTGERTFTPISAVHGAGYGLGNSTGAVAADYDNDGDLDLYLTNFGTDNLLFRNMWMEDHPGGVGDPASLRFVNATPSTDPTPSDPPGDGQHGLAYATYANPDPFFGTDRLDNSMAAAWADVNRDGWVDLYVGSYDGTNGDPQLAEDGQFGERDTLYLNNGDGTFTDITMAHAGPPQRWIDDGSFEQSVAGTRVSNSRWTLSATQDAAQFQQASWAASAGPTGVWFKGFVGSVANPADAEIRQVLTAPRDGDYLLSLDARIETHFPAAVGGFRAWLASSGTGGADEVDLIAALDGTNFQRQTLMLRGVTAGDELSLGVSMSDARGGSGPALSAMVDAFLLTSLDAAGQASAVGGWENFDGTFSDTELPAEFSSHNALQFADFNNDGWQDLIVATMGGAHVGPNRDMLYLNLGVGVDGSWRGYQMVSYALGFGGSESSDMGVAVADVDNDGDLDYYSTLLPDDHPLWINQGTANGALAFVRTEVPSTFAWGANFHDFDNNGRVDLWVGTAADRRTYLHLQDDQGQLVESGAAAGLTSTYATRGVAVADWNRDGWRDTAQWSRSEAQPGIQFYENRSRAENPEAHWLTVELEGDPELSGMFRSTRDAMGARVYVTADFDGDGVVQSDETRMEEVVSGHSNASTTSSLALEFGLGRASAADVRIVWGSGRETYRSDVAADQFVRVVEALPDGDFNGDGLWDCLDVDALVARVAEQVRDLRWDLDGDGHVDRADVAAWLVLAGAANRHPDGTYPEGDANLDGVVDISDFNRWNEHKFTATPAWCAGDFTADGSIDVADFNIWNASKFAIGSNVARMRDEAWSPLSDVRDSDHRLRATTTEAWHVRWAAAVFDGTG